MAKDISANAELSGGKIEAALSLSNNKLTTDAGIHGLIPVKVKAEQSDWNEDDPNSDAYIKNKPAIPSLDGYATEDWVEGKGYLIQHQSLLGYATEAWVNGKGYITGLAIMEYGKSTWEEVVAAIDANKVVYCKSPVYTGQWRYAFLAYVSNSSVEFQYYRSVNAHTASQMGDQVFVYTLSINGTWTMTTREASSKVVAGTGLESSYTKDKLTLSIKSDYPTKAEVSAMIAEALAAYANGNTE